MDLTEVIDTLKNKWIIVKNGEFGTNYYAQKVDSTSTKSDVYPFVANVVSRIYFI